MARCRGAEVRGGAPHARLARRWILVFCQVEAAMKWRAALEAGGAVYKRTCQWIKPDGKPQYSGDRPGIGYESIVACHAPGRSTWNGGGSHGVFIVNKGGDVRTGHQTQTPLALMQLLVRLFSDKGELVLEADGGGARAARARALKGLGPGCQAGRPPARLGILRPGCPMRRRPGEDFRQQAVTIAGSLIRRAMSISQTLSDFEHLATHEGELDRLEGQRVGA
jgi:hypothetical protein